jgi:hypothetical protein
MLRLGRNRGALQNGGVVRLAYIPDGSILSLTQETADDVVFGDTAKGKNKPTGR